MEVAQTLVMVGRKFSVQPVAAKVAAILLIFKCILQLKV